MRDNALSASGDASLCGSENAMELKRTRRPSRRDQLPVGLDDPWAGEDANWECDDDLQGESPREFMRFFRGTALAVVLGLAVWAAVLLLLFQTV
jgi:hypothetical protein